MDVMKKYIYDNYYRVYRPDRMPTNFEVIDNKSALLDEGSGYVLPFRKQYEYGKPGVYPTTMIQDNGYPVCIKCLPTTEEEKKEYSVENNFINFSDKDSTKDYMKNIDKQRRMNESHRCNIDDRYHPVIHHNDEPTAQISKVAQYEMDHDIYRYRDQFGPNFNNDKRALEASSITIKKLDEIYTKFDNGSKIMVAIFDDGSSPNSMENFAYGIINEPNFTPNTVARDSEIGKAMLSALEQQRNLAKKGGFEFNDEEEEGVE